MAINALDRSAMQKSLGKMRDFLGEGRHVAIESAGRSLSSAMRKRVGRKAASKKDFSAPGEPPLRKENVGRKQKEKYLSVYKSIGSQVVEGVRRVGSGSFVARLMEQGAFNPPSKKYPKGRIMKPRPFMAKALEDAEPKMTAALVGALKRRGDMGNVVDLEGAELPGGGRFRIDSGS